MTAPLSEIVAQLRLEIGLLEEQLQSAREMLAACQKVLAEDEAKWVKERDSGG